MVTVIMVLAIIMPIASSSSFVYAQTLLSPLPFSPQAQQIINDAKAECEAAYFFQPRCVELVYESPETVVLRGLVLIFGGENPSTTTAQEEQEERQAGAFYSNPFLWKTVDEFKAQGYIITDVEVTVLGNKSTNSEFNVIMSK
jgi:hypothetical protein